MTKKRKRDLMTVATLIIGVRPHKGMWHSGGYAPSRQRQVKKAFKRLRRRGVPPLRAMTDAALEVGAYA